jgi:hypothetical protein
VDSGGVSVGCWAPEVALQLVAGDSKQLESSSPGLSRDRGWRETTRLLKQLVLGALRA